MRVAVCRGEMLIPVNSLRKQVDGAGEGLRALCRSALRGSAEYRHQLSPFPGGEAARRLVDLLARELRELIEEAGRDFVGACLDTGNPAYGGEDPVVSAEVLAPYAVTSHVRDTRIWATEQGAMAQWVPLGEGNVDLQRIVRLLAEHAPDAPIDLEIITGGQPVAIPYLEPESDYWRQYPTMLARDFARFITVASQGKAHPLVQLTLPPGTGAPPADRIDRPNPRTVRIRAAGSASSSSAAKRAPVNRLPPCGSSFARRLIGMPRVSRPSGTPRRCE